MLNVQRTATFVTLLEDVMCAVMDSSEDLITNASHAHGSVTNAKDLNFAINASTPSILTTQELVSLAMTTAILVKPLQNALIVLRTSSLTHKALVQHVQTDALNAYPLLLVPIATTDITWKTTNAKSALYLAV